jgi:hypothetical protein
MQQQVPSASYERRDVEPRELQERAPDVPTVTVTAATPVNVTQTFYAPTTITDTVTTVVSNMVYTTLPPSTVKTGTVTSTVTLPQATRTKLDLTYTTAFSTITLTAT